jgi:hypothetical protein
MDRHPPSGSRRHFTAWRTARARRFEHDDVIVSHEDRQDRQLKVAFDRSRWFISRVLQSPKSNSLAFEVDLV